MALTAHPRRRVFWLLGALALVLLIAATQRSQWVKIPNGQAYRCLREQDLTGAQWWHNVSNRMAPRDPENEFIQARIWRHGGEFEKARACLSRAKDAGFPIERAQREEWLVDVQEGRMNDAESRLANLFKDSQGDEVEICDAFVAGFTRVGNYVPALALLASWEKDYPLDPQPHYRRAVILQEQRRWNEGEEQLEQALKLNPRHGSSALLMGELLLADKRPEQALPYFERTQDDVVNRTAGRLGMAKALSAMGNSEKAERLLLDLLSKNSDYLEAAVAMSQIEMSRGDYRAALERLKPFKTRHPHDFDLSYAHAMALRGTGSVEQAQAELQSFAESRALLDRTTKLKKDLDARPQDTDLRFELGKICLQIGIKKEGVRWLNTVLALEPMHVETHQLLADYYSQHREANPQFDDLSKHHAAQAESARQSSRQSAKSGE